MCEFCRVSKALALSERELCVGGFLCRDCGIRVYFALVKHKADTCYKCWYFFF